MATMQQLRDIVNNTPADAADVEWNFNTIESFVGLNLLNVDGSVAMTGPLSLSGAPVGANDAATKAYVDGSSPSLIPIGSMIDYGGSTAPPGWLSCNGAIIGQAEYPTLFSIIGTTYNTGGEGGTQFRIPDLRQRTTVGIGSGTGFTAAGTVGGSANAVVGTHTHAGSTSTNTHSHRQYVRKITGVHITPASGTQIPISDIMLLPESTLTDSHDHTLTIANAGVSPTNMNYAPYLVINKIIRVV